MQCGAFPLHCPFAKHVLVLLPWSVEPLGQEYLAIPPTLCVLTSKFTPLKASGSLHWISAQGKKNVKATDFVGFGVVYLCILVDLNSRYRFQDTVVLIRRLVRSWSRRSIRLKRRSRWRLMLKLLFRFLLSLGCHSQRLQGRKNRRV